MRTRIMSGAVLIVILFTCLYFGGWVTFGFSLFISLVGMYELIKVKKLEKTGLAVVGYIAAITYYFILLLNDPAYILLLLVASCILMMYRSMIGRWRPESSRSLSEHLPETLLSEIP